MQSQACLSYAEVQLILYKGTARQEKYKVKVPFNAFINGR